MRRARAGQARESLTGWGRTAATVAEVVAPGSPDEVAGLVRSRPVRGVIARGLGRSYGDAAQNAGGLVLRLDGLHGIGPVDPATGSVTCGAGVSLDRLIRTVLPQGWFVPVTPGTRHVTLGGAIASDVHGKNHHRDGSISAHVTSLTLVDGSGELRTLTPADDLFWAVPGGMGLTGIVVAATLQLVPCGSGLVEVDTRRTADLDETMAVLPEADRDHRYTVAWVDCLSSGAKMGRGVVTAGDHADPALSIENAALSMGSTALSMGDAHRESRFGRAVQGSRRAPLGRLSVPTPRWVPVTPLNPTSIGLFNDAYHAKAPRARRSLEPLGSFFHPLDALHGWNRLYGPRGFVQHQLAAPQPETIQRVITLLSRRRAPTFLCVLKRFGPAGRGPLSFPQPGWTLAVDLPVSDGVGPLLDEIDAEVIAAGGRVYLTKDARLRPDALPQMYPRLAEWQALRDRLDPNHVFASDLSRRLHL